MDWSKGTYELTAPVLAPVSEVVVATAGITPGEVVVDVATGTGNAALAAARAGATVIGVDPAERLLEVAGERAAAEGLVVRLQPGTATALPVDDDAADAALSVFGVIFEPDGPAAVRELVRVVRPGGRVLLTAWTADGPVYQTGALLRRTVAEAFPGEPALAPSTDWTDAEVVRRLLEEHGCAVTIEPRTVPFTASSPEQWFADQEEHHPVWKQLRALLTDVEGAWDRVREQSVAILSAANEDATAFRTTSRYWLVRADVPE